MQFLHCKTVEGRKQSCREEVTPKPITQLFEILKGLVHPHVIPNPFVHLWNTNKDVFNDYGKICPSIECPFQKTFPASKRLVCSHASSMVGSSFVFRRWTKVLQVWKQLSNWWLSILGWTIPLILTYSCQCWHSVSTIFVQWLLNYTTEHCPTQFLAPFIMMQFSSSNKIKKAQIQYLF